MKNNKKIIFIIIISIAIILIGIGLYFLIPNESKNSTQKQIKDIREYQTVVKNSPTTEGQITSIDNVKDNFEQDAKNIGFEKIECKDSNCTASKKGYTNAEQEDMLNLSKDEYGDTTMVVILHFHKNDCIVNNVYSKLNSVTNNYFGSKIQKVQIEKIITEMEQSEDHYGSLVYTSGEYTIDVSIQYVVDTDFRILKYRVITTKLYNEYGGA